MNSEPQPSTTAFPAWPISFEDVLAAEQRIRPHLPPTAARSYAVLDEAVGNGISLVVKHENHNPTNAFKVRNALSAISVMPVDTLQRGVVTATRGNHGQGVAWAARIFGTSATICVPVGNNPEKNEAMRGLGAELIEQGESYDEALEVAERLTEERGLAMVHSTNNRDVLAGAGTIALELLEQDEGVDSLVLAIGGGSQAVGALTVARQLRPELEIIGVQAEMAPAGHDSWHAGRRSPRPIGPTIADGLATGDVYDLTFETLRVGLADFITVTEGEISEAIRILLRTTHSLVEGGGAAGLAGVLELRERLRGKRVAIYLTGGNIDQVTLQRVLREEI